MTQRDEANYRELMQQAVRELRKARTRIGELERRERSRKQPANIVGIGCRLPKAIEDAKALWQFFLDGRSHCGPLPETRWQPAAVPEVPPPGAWLDDVFGFDAGFFRMSPREARCVDPQQRLLLEVAHATIEHAGIAPGSLRGSNTGVFVGISAQDWAQHLTENLPPDEIDGANGPGTNPCAAAGRVSFALGLEGPSLSVNTACSSSLVALHLAMQSLRTGACDLALVLGVNAMLSPLTTVTFQRAGMLAADGRCKTFAADADGYGRGEGAVGILLASEDAAKSHNLRRHAQVLGSAVNQDGATAGLTVPNGAAQQRVVRAALDDAGAQPDEVQFIEAHGTGTLLGDPIELNALGAVFGKREQPVHVASAKTNFGHLEAAAGLLSIVKAALQIEHGVIAPHLHFLRPNPHVDWATLPLRVPTSRHTLPEQARRVGGVSSFSFTGTNAHVVLAAAPPAAAIADVHLASDQEMVLPLSAASETSLRSLCGRWSEHLRAHPQLRLQDVAATAALGRTAYRVRTAVAATTIPGAIERLQQLADGSQPLAQPSGSNDLARRFAAGDTIEWRDHLPKVFERLPLPTYVFDRQQLRVDSRAEIRVPPTALQTDHAGLDLDSATEDERPELLRQHLRRACADILRMQPVDIDASEPLLTYGFDSMRAVELATRLELDLGQPMPFGDLIDGATIHDVAAAIVKRSTATPAATASSDDDALLRRIAAMSDDEAQRALRKANGDG